MRFKIRRYQFGNFAGNILTEFSFLIVGRYSRKLLVLTYCSFIIKSYNRHTIGFLSKAINTSRRYSKPTNKSIFFIVTNQQTTTIPIQNSS